MRAHGKRIKLREYIFEGTRVGKYSEESVGRIIKRSAARAGIRKNVYPHMLDHRFATHHIEQGTDLRYIQDWLNHASSKTTERYTNVSQRDFKKFKNPLDDILKGT